MTPLIDTQHVFAGEYTQSNRPEMLSETMVFPRQNTKLPKLPRFPQKKHHNTWFPRKKTWCFPVIIPSFATPGAEFFIIAWFSNSAPSHWALTDPSAWTMMGIWQDLGSWENDPQNWDHGGIISSKTGNCGISVRQLWDDCGITICMHIPLFLLAFTWLGNSWKLNS